MERLLVINVSLTETRVALIEDGRPVELYHEARSSHGVVGNIYRGRVVRVLPGMQAAFVDIGLSRTGFLYVSDAAVPTAGVAFGATPPEGIAIERLLKEGQEVVVQVRKEPLGTKGARLTRQVSLPGRNLVLMPYSEHVGVSQRIDDDLERERLRRTIEGLLPPGCGWIVRTAARDLDPELLEAEARELLARWEHIYEESRRPGAPRLVYADLDLPMRAARDLLSTDGAKVVVDDAPLAERIREMVASFGGPERWEVLVYDGPEPIFEHFALEQAISRALHRRVWLKSGGTIVIDEAEALTVIDVNTGRFVGSSSLEETITRTNLEAVAEVARQLRLRNLGGIIVIDFIDMAQADNRQRVLEALEEALKRDKARTTLVGMSELGLVQMTRKRVQENLQQTLTEICDHCEGTGRVRSPASLAHELIRALEGRLKDERRTPRVQVELHPRLGEALRELSSALEELEATYATKIELVEAPQAAVNHWSLRDLPDS